MGFVLGAVLLVGPTTAISYFSQRSKLRGTCIFGLGFFLVFMGHPIIGLLCELFGFLNLFGYV
jgi:Got1/Sft2-like family